jgi:hypothetical protein
MQKYCGRNRYSARHKAVMAHNVEVVKILPLYGIDRNVIAGKFGFAIGRCHEISGTITN